jgi:hypothetical protein
VQWTRNRKEASWQPTLPSANKKYFTMADVLAFVDDLKPLGDAAPVA